MTSPLQTFLAGQQAGQNIVANQQALDVQRQLNPIRQQQAELGLTQDQMGLITQRAQLLSNTLDAIGRSSVDPQSRFALAQRAVPELQQLGIEIDPADMAPEQFTDEGLAQLKAETTGFVQDPQTAISNIQQAVAIPGVGFQTLTREGDVGLRTLSPDQQAQVNAAFESEAQRKADAAGLKSGAIEESKLSVQRDIKPEIERAIITARQEAESRGETLTDLNRAKAALPGLQDVVAQLRQLTPIATATFSGRLFDAAAREAGFGSNKGANARAKYIAIIDNELLPLLRQTFGSAFTEGEGERLKATLGDPNLGVDEKNAQLDAFIESKLREIETKERELRLPQEGGIKFLGFE